MAFSLGLTKFFRFFVQIASLGLGAFLVLRGETDGRFDDRRTSILLGRALAPVELAMSAWRNFWASSLFLSRLQPAAMERFDMYPPRNLNA